MLSRIGHVLFHAASFESISASSHTKLDYQNYPLRKDLSQDLPKILAQSSSKSKLRGVHYDAQRVEMTKIPHASKSKKQRERACIFHQKRFPIPTRASKLRSMTSQTSNPQSSDSRSNRCQPPSALRSRMENIIFHEADARRRTSNHESACYHQRDIGLKAKKSGTTTNLRRKENDVGSSSGFNREAPSQRLPVPCLLTV